MTKFNHEINSIAWEIVFLIIVYYPQIIANVKVVEP